MEDLKDTIDTQLLQYYIRKKGFDNIADLAAETGISQVVLSDICCGTRAPTSGEMYRLVEVLKLSGKVAGQIFFS